MLPLKGLKVLDLSRVLAGPYASQILGDLGAEVLKVEEKSHGDETRSWGPPFFEGQSSYYLAANRNKKSIALDFKNADDLKVALDLADDADILIENFKFESLKKFGLDYECLATRNPRLIYCSITGFGHSGPRAHEPGYDVLIQALGGLMSITGPDAESPTKVGVAVTDLATGLYAVIGILAALKEREQSGKGQHIDIALFDTQVSLLANIGMNFLTSKEIPQPIGNRHPSIVPYGSYRTKDQPLMLTIGNDKQFEHFCIAAGKAWHQDGRFRTNENRVLNRASLETEIQRHLETKNRNDWLEIFRGKGFPFGPIQNLKELSNDPQLKARDLFTTMNDGKTPCIRSPLRFSRTPIRDYKTPPSLGENSKDRFTS